MRGRSRMRSTRPPLQTQSPVLNSPLPSPGTLYQSQSKDEHGFYRSTSLETRSRTPSPTTSQSPSQQEYYGSTNLIDRSRSPSPSPTQSPPKRMPRKLPPVPIVPGTPPPGMGPGQMRGASIGNTSSAVKPASLNLTQPKLKETMPRVMPSPTVPQPPRSPSSINFPRLSISPTRLPRNIEAENRDNPHIFRGQSKGTGDKSQNQPVSSHHVPPPGRLARPEPYSPTEKSIQSKGDSTGSPRQRRGNNSLPSRTSGRGSSFPEDPAWGRGDREIEPVAPDRDPSPHGASGRSPDLRNSDRNRILAHQFDNVPSDSSSPGISQSEGRGRSRSSKTVPNGFKPKGRKTERYEMRSDINAPLKEDSDEDDDWC